MAIGEPDFKGFGELEPVGTRFATFWLVMKAALLVVLLALVWTAYSGWSSFYQHFLEGEQPIIKVISPPPGFGLEPGELKLSITDAGAGLDEVIVRMEQGSTREDILRKTYDTAVSKDTLLVPIDAKRRELREGSLRLHIIVFDKSFWSNSAKAVLEFPIDYQPPQIDVLTRQHNAVQGGVELVFYRVRGEQSVFSGVRVGSSLFPGFPASELDSDFAGLRDLYFSFFSIPRGFDEKRESPEVFARDAVGNMASASFYYRAKKMRSVKTLSREVDLEKYQQEIEPLFEDFQRDLAKTQKIVLPELLEATDQAQREARARAVLIDYRNHIEEQLSHLFSHPKSARFWQGKFGRQPGRRLPLDYGTPLEFSYKGEKLTSYPMNYTFFKNSPGAPVWAASEGVVIFADKLGPYGNSVILDHGFGLTTRYSHLSSIENLEGARVSSGDLLGRSGGSGFLPFGEGTAFEIRLHGQPVRPEEWWDASWIADHIENKIQGVKRDLGVLSFKVLER